MKKFIWLVILILVVSFGFRWWWNTELTAVSSNKNTKIFVIDKGESLNQIAKQLKKENLIKSEWAFTTLAKQEKLDSQIQPGTFRLSSSQSAMDILKTLTANPLDNWVTLLEGWRVEEMADKLSEQGAVDGQQFVKQAKIYEGYLFPDTYLFPKDVTVEQIIKKLRDNFDQKYSDDLKTKIKKQGINENQGVILASIVEREARSDQARTMVASILLKRFKIGMGLNVDSTVQYALGYQPAEKSWWKRHLSGDDLKVDSPYNTYIHSGFPPTPICNPSLASLKAVANADSSTSYLYYYHDSKGNSYYAKTLEEHNQNVANNP